MKILLSFVVAFIVGIIFSFIPKKELQIKETEEPAKRKGQLFLWAFIIFAIAAVIFVIIDLNK